MKSTEFTLEELLEIYEITHYCNNEGYDSFNDSWDYPDLPYELDSKLGMAIRSQLIEKLSDFSHMFIEINCAIMSNISDIDNVIPLKKFGGIVHCVFKGIEVQKDEYGRSDDYLIYLHCTEYDCDIELDMRKSNIDRFVYIDTNTYLLYKNMPCINDIHMKEYYKNKIIYLNPNIVTDKFKYDYENDKRTNERAYQKITDDTFIIIRDLFIEGDNVVLIGVLNSDIFTSDHIMTEVYLNITVDEFKNLKKFKDSKSAYTIRKLLDDKFDRDNWGVD